MVKYTIKPGYNGAKVQIMNPGSGKCCRGMMRVITLADDTLQNDLAYLYVLGHPSVEMEIKVKKPIKEVYDTDHGDRSL